MQEYETALTLLRRAAELSPNNGETFHRIGRTLWDMGGQYRTDKQQAHAMFLRAARLDPNNAANFTYLGRFYDTVELDTNKALKCFQKAVSLHPREEEVCQ